ncbi:L-gulonolactone oxidase [Robertmurraya andreesenii]|uniref:L-gulonolactone oxidase n=1 Tax=Anoxybacillus andreesenii TaxID=1325932 RepID=A0ABT9UZT5_9BACL|nr:L-gulonolactone oxidase [Robertmurraya andreesenii]
MIKTVQGQTWKNWSQSVESHPEKILYPATIDEVCTLVREAKQQRKKIRVVGAGHSFTRLVQTDVWLVSLDLLSGIEELDEGKMTVTVLGGTRLFQIGEELGRRGFAQENLGDINVQSIAGAISTGTHGNGIGFGNVSSQVLEITIVTASGEVMTISETMNDKYFKASLVSLGSLGIIVKVKLRMIKSPVYEYRSDKVRFSELIEKLDYLIDSNRHFEFYLFPFSDLVQIKTMNITNRQPQRLTFHHLESLVLENYLFFLLSELCRWFPRTTRFVSRLSAKAIGTTSIAAHSYQLFATPRKVKFNEIEYCIPLENMKEAIQEVREHIETNQYEVHFPIECRTVKADDIWLSPSYQRDSAYIAFHMYKGMPYERYFRDMEAIMQKHGGRPHWGKMHKREHPELLSLYPRFADFLNVRQELDPDGMFLNEYLRELFVWDKAEERTGS